MSDIRRLDDTTVDRIAAGEVVERPASVVKELVENSLDAEAERIAVSVAAGGTERIEVRDDGSGMSGDEVELAVAEHATSKIRDIDDLEAGVGSLGFRGEALHAIGAVSRLTLRSRERGSDHGTELRVEGGDIVAQESVGCPEGTTVIVEDLFYNVPARRKYLKSETTEFSRLNRIVSGYALANPGVAISLSHDGRETFATEGNGDRRAAVMAVYGHDVATNMVPVGTHRGDETADDGPLDAVRGLVSHPETNRASRDYINVFVNDRWVTTNAVREAVVEAYGRQLAGDRYPFAAIDLRVDPASVDVNVHPRKLEVRFADEAGVRRQVREAVESGLLAEGLVRTSAPRGQSKAAQTEIEPDTAGNATDSMDDTTDHLETTDGTPLSDSPDPTTGSGIADSTREESAPTDVAPQSRRDVADTTAGAATDHETDRTADREGGRHHTPPPQQTLDGRETSAVTHEFNRLPAMRVLGQLADTYLVAEANDGLLLIDQHAADERVNYERLRQQFAGEVQTQALAEAVDVSVTARETALAEMARETLARLGFRATVVDDRTLRVRTVPALLADAGGPELIRDLVADIAEGDPDRTIAAAVDDLLGDLACYPAVTGNTSLAEGDATGLLSALDDCENPWACPHGRPVVVEVSHEEIDARFERDYPGHDG